MLLFLDLLNLLFLLFLIDCLNLDLLSESFFFVGLFLLHLFQSQLSLLLQSLIYANFIFLLKGELVLNLSFNLLLLRLGALVILLELLLVLIECLLVLLQLSLGGLELSIHFLLLPLQRRLLEVNLVGLLQGLRPLLGLSL